MKTAKESNASLGGRNTVLLQIANNLLIFFTDHRTPTRNQRHRRFPYSLDLANATCVDLFWRTQPRKRALEHLVLPFQLVRRSAKDFVRGTPGVSGLIRLEIWVDARQADDNARGEEQASNAVKSGFVRGNQLDPPELRPASRKLGVGVRIRDKKLPEKSHRLNYA